MGRFTDKAQRLRALWQELGRRDRKMMLTCESPQEAKLLEFIAHEMADRDVTIEALSTDAGGAVDVTLRLPASANRGDREAVLRLLSDFEARVDFTVITNPTILLGAPSED